MILSGGDVRDRPGGRSAFDLAHVLAGPVLLSVDATQLTEFFRIVTGPDGRPLDQLHEVRFLGATRVAYIRERLAAVAPDREAGTVTVAFLRINP